LKHIPKLCHGRCCVITKLLIRQINQVWLLIITNTSINFVFIYLSPTPPPPAAALPPPSLYCHHHHHSSWSWWRLLKASQVVDVHVVAIIIIILWCRCCNIFIVLAIFDDVEADGAFESSLLGELDKGTALVGIGIGLMHSSTNNPFATPD
jgi:hypothetical protein